MHDQDQADPQARVRRWVYRVVIGGAFAMAAASAATARDAPPVAPFTGTLQKIYERGVIRVGHRENSPPFSFLDAQRRPIGYSLNICEVVVDEVSRYLHKPLEVVYVPVTPVNRFELVDSGSVDVECGSTTASAERRQKYGFSPTIFVTGTKLLVRRGSGIHSLRDLKGKVVVLTKGTIQAEAIPKLAARQNIPIRFEFAADHDQSFQALAGSQAEAFANDDVQLYGAVAARTAAADYRVVGDFLTYADYALMFRRDDAEFEGVVRQAFDRMAASGEIRAIYRKWFQQPLPAGASLALPMSPHLEHVFRLQGLAAD
jgi:ABC-type amino acid transport substrate-binding protein